MAWMSTAGLFRSTKHVHKNPAAVEIVLVAAEAILAGGQVATGADVTSNKGQLP